MYIYNLISSIQRLPVDVCMLTMMMMMIFCLTCILSVRLPLFTKTGREGNYRVSSVYLYIYIYSLFSVILVLFIDWVYIFGYCVYIFE